MTPEQAEAVRRFRRSRGCTHGDVAIIAEMWESDHPADDSHPLTSGWLEQNGFVRAFDSCLEFNPEGSVPILYYPNRGIAVNGNTIQFLPHITTRGELRVLCASLGTPIK